MAQRYTENLKNASKRFIFCYICNNTTFYYRSKCIIDYFNIESYAPLGRLNPKFYRSPKGAYDSTKNKYY